MTKLVVVDGATLKCSGGTKLSKLIVTNKADVKVHGARVASIFDHKSGENFDTFGQCEIQGNCCVPDTPSLWSSGGAGVNLSQEVVLVETSLLNCTKCGTIKVDDPNQSTTSVEEMCISVNDVALLERNYLRDLFQYLDFGDKTQEIRDKLMDNIIKNANAEKLRILFELFRHLGPQQARDVISGAHVVLHDGQRLYRLVDSSNSRYHRSSSHGDVQRDDLGFDLPGPGTVLFGRSKDKSNSTHFQFEEHGTHGAGEETGHIWDWFQGKAHHGGKQKGLYDLDSEKDDKNPIHIYLSK